MPLRTYNNFTNWVQQDDFLTDWANFIDQKNIDWIRDWYGVTLWPKVHKWLITNEAMRAMDFTSSFVTNLGQNIIGGDNGEIYHANSTDSTPAYTLSNGGNILNIVSLASQYYIFYTSSLAFNKIVDVARISHQDAWNDNWTGIEEEFATFVSRHAWVPPMIVVGSLIFLGSSSSINTLDTGWDLDTYGFPDSDVVGITLQGSTIAVYCESGNVYLWDGWALTESARTYMWSRISKVVQRGNIDYIHTEDGQMYAGSGLSFQRIMKPKVSNRMDDNTSFNIRLSFELSDEDNVQNRTSLNALGDIYMYANDTVRGIYKYWRLIPWQRDTLHKVVTHNHAGTQIDHVYDMFFYERNIKRLFFSYKAWDTYGVDFLNLQELETCNDGYMVSDVFSWGTSYTKEIKWLKIATSNTAWNNYIKLYYRIDNWDWEILRTMNYDSNTIEVENINTVCWEPFKEFIDVQFKIELHYDDGESVAPILHELGLDYNIIKV